MECHNINLVLKIAIQILTKTATLYPRYISHHHVTSMEMYYWQETHHILVGIGVREFCVLTTRHFSENESPSPRASFCTVQHLDVEDPFRLSRRKTRLSDRSLPPHTKPSPQIYSIMFLSNLLSQDKYTCQIIEIVLLQGIDR